jgi:hypothetical protein
VRTVRFPAGDRYTGMSASQPRRTPLSATLDLSIPRPTDEHTGCRREIQRLLIENARLAADLSDTRARYDDLKRSAEMWINLYERQLQGKETSS